MSPLTQPVELLLESVFQTSLNGILLCQALRNEYGKIIDFEVVRCNPQAAALTGFSQQQILANTMLTLDPDGLINGIFERYVEVVETGLSNQVEHYFEGANIWMMQSLAKYEDGLISSIADITEIKLAEQQSKREAQLLQTILDNAQTGIAVMDAVRDETGRIIDFAFTHINRDAERITKRTKAELIGRRYSVVWPGSLTNGVLDWHIRVAQTGEPARLDGMNYPVDSYNGWYNVRIRPYGNGVITTFVDVTALKRAELANEQHAELLRSVLDSSSNAIIAFSAVRGPDTGKIIDFRYVAQNKANRQNPVRTDEEVIGRTMLEYFPHVISTGLFDHYVQVVETGEPTRFEQEYNYDELTGWYEISVVKWGDGMVLTLVDITNIKRYLEQIEQANVYLQRANDNLQQFTYIASHDLQEPLRKIMAFSDVLKTQFAPNLGDQGLNIIERMHSATSRMSELIRDVVAYSRVSSANEVFRPVSLRQVLAEVIRDLQMGANMAQVQVAIEVDELPDVLGDLTQLYLLFENLLSNALKFRTQGEGAIIRVGCRNVMSTESSLGKQGGFCEISVQDNGIGFEQKYADRIFQVFQRLHTGGQYAGTGMGLAICKRIVENHNGVIIASGQPGKGATFRVYLPV